MDAGAGADRAAAAPTAEITVTGLDEFWCSDCLSRALFERVLHVEAGSDGESQWACTECGAAYFDAIDLIVDLDFTGRHRGAA